MLQCDVFILLIFFDQWSKNNKIIWLTGTLNWQKRKSSHLRNLKVAMILQLQKWPCENSVIVSKGLLVVMNLQIIITWALLSFIENFSSVFSCPVHDFIVWFLYPLSYCHIQPQRAAVFSEKALDTHCTLPAEHQTADTSN